MSAEGIAAALSSFVGQNYGSKDYDRIQRGCKITLLIAIITVSYTHLDVYKRQIGRRAKAILFYLLATF